MRTTLDAMSRRSLIMLALLLAGCGDATTPTSTIPSTPSTTVAEPSSTTTQDAEQGATSTITAPESTTQAPASTSTSPPGGASALRIDEIVFAGGPYVIISNLGTGPGSTAGYWICQFPSYYALPAVDLLPGEKLAVPLGVDPVPDLIGVVAIADVSLPIGEVTTRDGELGLYSDNTFNSSDAIVDYVEWGMTGHARSDVAVEAGIWETGGFVEVPDETLAVVAEAFPTLGPDDWFAEIGG